MNRTNYVLHCRLKEEFVFFLYSDGTKTLSWLSEEAAQRYYKMVGLRPALTLGTKDGAFFSPDDLIKMVLSDNDKVSILKLYEEWLKNIKTFLATIFSRTATCTFYSRISMARTSLVP